MRIISYPHRAAFFAVFSLLLFISSCKKDEGESPFTIDVFYEKMESLTLEVAYEPGAEPYDFNTNGDNVWQFVELNIEALFTNRPLQMDVIIPSGLSQMTLLPDQTNSGFTANDILNLADRYRQDEGGDISGNIFILFLDGYFKQDDTIRQNIAGVSITGTTVVAVFKPVIIDAHPQRIFREFMEQSIAIHEIGHAVGLVKNGLPLTSSHQDIPHGAHCTNTDCVMYWENEHTTTNLSAFVQGYQSGNKPVIFGAECIADVTDYEP